MFNLFRGSYILEYFPDNVNRNAEYFPTVTRKPTIKRRNVYNKIAAHAHIDCYLPKFSH